MAMTIYVKGKSKKALNELLAKSAILYGENFSAFGGGGYYQLNKDLPSGTVIKVYEKMSMGSPYAKAYGTWNAEKNKIM
jgi:hypothetical protein